MDNGNILVINFFKYPHFFVSIYVGTLVLNYAG